MRACVCCYQSPVTVHMVLFLAQRIENILTLVWQQEVIVLNWHGAGRLVWDRRRRRPELSWGKVLLCYIYFLTTSWWPWAAVSRCNPIRLTCHGIRRRPEGSWYIALVNMVCLAWNMQVSNKSSSLAYVIVWSQSLQTPERH